MSDLNALRQEFWAASPDALFPSKYITAIRHCSNAQLERERWLGIGPRYLKVSSRVLYRKADVLDWIAAQDQARSA
jgi:hypothetical protein